MARRRVSMNKIREILRLHEHGLSKRQLAKSVNVSRPVVAEYVERCIKQGIQYKDIEQMKNDELLKVLEKDGEKKSKQYQILSEKFPYIAKELKRAGVTLAVLWKEYKEENPQGFSYSRFCYHYQVWRHLSCATMHIEHKAGDKMFVDFTGKKLHVYDVKTKQYREVEVFVAVLPASQLTYVEAVESQKSEDWIKANENAFWYFEGVSQAIVPDCLKAGVSNADMYEPDINPVYADFARHYDTVIVPARPYKSRDKAMVENAVRLVYMRIFSALRDQIFYSVGVLNYGIREQLQIHNNLPFQRLKVSRMELFNEIERSVLQPLPAGRYAWKTFLHKKVQFNYHIELTEDRHYYSVPWQYHGKRVNIIYTTDVVEIYNQNQERIAFHKRERTRNGYTTVKEHMPSTHQFYAQWSPQRMIQWGEKIGSEVKSMIEQVLGSRKHPEQAFKACLGILNLAKKYGDMRLNQACVRALDFRCYSYKAVKHILERGLDSIKEDRKALMHLPEHSNIRGGAYYTEAVSRRGTGMDQGENRGITSSGRGFSLI